MTVTYDSVTVTAGSVQMDRFIPGKLEICAFEECAVDEPLETRDCCKCEEQKNISTDSNVKDKSSNIFPPLNEKMKPKRQIKGFHEEKTLHQESVTTSNTGNPITEESPPKTQTFTALWKDESNQLNKKIKAFVA